MPTIEMQHPAGLSAALVGPELLRILREIQDKTGGHNDFSLAVDLSALHLPNAGRLSVPIDLRVGAVHGPHASIVDFHFSARFNRDLFPAFEGTLRSDALGASQSAVWFSGTYTPPLGALGRALDATVVRGVAERTLADFLRAICAEAEAAINARERNAIRMTETTR